MVEKGRVFARHVHWRLVNGGDSVTAIGNARRMMLPSCPSDAARKSLGFMTLAETRALADRQVVVPDPGSTLVSSSIRFGSGVVLWPNTTLQCLDGGAIAIGPGTIIFPGTRVVASGGVVTVGSGAELGEEGGFTIKADAPSTIRIGDGARLLGGGSLTLSNTVGTGAQVIGPIRCRNCRLGDGDSYREPDPDLRGGVLKGSGVAHDLHVPQGHVIQSFGLFAEAPLRRQSYFHPKRQT
jgi:hypothetical protein